MATMDGWHLGMTSARRESGGRGAETISTGKGDHGGVSYGTYQLSSKAGRCGNIWINRVTVASFPDYRLLLLLSMTSGPSLHVPIQRLGRISMIS